jgi:hypothetical protein
MEPPQYKITKRQSSVTHLWEVQAKVKRWTYIICIIVGSFVGYIYKCTIKCLAYLQLTEIKIIAYYELQMPAQEAAMIFFKMLRPSQQIQSGLWL